MSVTTETRNLPLGDLLRELGSERGLPGSGAAAAIALALAAACAAKAAALTLKHSPTHLQLHQVRERLLACIDAALEGAERDTERFVQFLHCRSSQAAQSVIAADEKLLSLVDELAAILEALDPQVRQNVAGDLVAARALSQAARAIQTANISEMRASGIA